MTDPVSNPYSPPGAAMKDSPLAAPSRPGIGHRFLLTAACAFPVFFACVLGLPNAEWGVGAVGAVMFAVLTGIVAICIPVRNKFLFVVPSIVLGLTVALLLGRVVS